MDDQPGVSRALGCGRIVARVLVVEDEPLLRDLVAAVLQDEGYAVATAAHGVAGLAEVRRALPDAVILDLMMPVMDGPTFLTAFRRLPDCRTIPVVIVSAVKAELERARQLAAHAWLAKPYDLDDLIATVGRFIRSVPA